MGYMLCLSHLLKAHKAFIYNRQSIFENTLESWEKRHVHKARAKWMWEPRRQGQILGHVYPLRLNHETEDANRPTMSNEITHDNLIASLPTKKCPEPDGSTTDLHQTVKEKQIPVLFKLFQEIEKEDGDQTQSIKPASFCYWSQTRKHSRRSAAC